MYEKLIINMCRVEGASCREKWGGAFPAIQVLSQAPAPRPDIQQRATTPPGRGSHDALNGFLRVPGGSQCAGCFGLRSVGRVWIDSTLRQVRTNEELATRTLLHGELGGASRMHAYRSMTFYSLA